MMMMMMTFEIFRNRQFLQLHVTSLEIPGVCILQKALLGANKIFKQQVVAENVFRCFPFVCPVLTLCYGR